MDPPVLRSEKPIEPWHSQEMMAFKTLTWIVTETAWGGAHQAEFAQAA
jgi:hypothetical protein